MFSPLLKLQDSLGNWESGKKDYHSSVALKVSLNLTWIISTQLISEPRKCLKSRLNFSREIEAFLSNGANLIHIAPLKKRWTAQGLQCTPGTLPTTLKISPRFVSIKVKPDLFAAFSALAMDPPCGPASFLGYFDISAMQYAMQLTNSIHTKTLNCERHLGDHHLVRCIRHRQTCRPNIQFSKCLKKTLTQSFWACAQKDVECMGKCWSSRIGCQVWDPGSVIAFVVQHGEKSPLLFSHLLDAQWEFPHAIDPQSVHFGCTNGTWWEVL